MLELGPGLGVLTEALLEAGAQVTAVELDRDMAAFIRERLPAVSLVEGDGAALGEVGASRPGAAHRVALRRPPGEAEGGRAARRGGEKLGQTSSVVYDHCEFGCGFFSEYEEDHPEDAQQCTAAYDTVAMHK